ncbi:hypothetical protein [Nocardia acidivorans]|uniref:hypothetical protein n=1 Tax=Nocardia acidivorans TaxID=404580 RepID=UPI00082E2C07|nr:hypothetical protein [Nocardia acidivorans]
MIITFGLVLLAALVIIAVTGVSSISVQVKDLRRSLGRFFARVTGRTPPSAHIPGRLDHSVGETEQGTRKEGEAFEY